MTSTSDARSSIRPGEITSSAHVPQDPFIDIPGVPNVRDIGGYSVIDPLSSRTAGHVNYGKLFRGSDTTSITSAGCHKFHELGISTQFDLRSQQQIDRAGTVREIDGVTRHWTPIFDQAEYTIEKAGLRYQQYAGDGTEGIVQAFTEIVMHGAPAFKQIMLHIASQASQSSANPSRGGVYISCTTGNNRTGPFVSLLLSYLGVSPAQVCEEYALSEQGLATTRAKTVARLRSNSKFAASFEENELEYRATRMTGARPESMAAFLEHVEKTWGGAEGYFSQVLGLDKETLKRVKQVMTVD